MANVLRSLRLMLLLMCGRRCGWYIVEMYKRATPRVFEKLFQLIECAVCKMVSHVIHFE